MWPIVVSTVTSWICLCFNEYMSEENGLYRCFYYQQYGVCGSMHFVMEGEYVGNTKRKHKRKEITESFIRD